MMFLSRLTNYKKVCCCIPLKLGCLFIGCFEIVGHSLGVWRILKSDDEWIDELSNFLLGVLLIITNLCLVLGINKEKKWLLLPWLITKFLAYLYFTVDNGISIYEAAFIIPEMTNSQHQTYAISFCCLLTTLILLAWYSFFCVYSFYKIGFKTEIEKETITQNSEEDDKKSK